MIEDWRPISLLNVDLKIFSKAVASRLRACLDTIISSEQCKYVQETFISLNGRLIYDILEACELFGVEGYLLSLIFKKFSIQLITVFAICLKNLWLWRNFHSYY